MRAARFESGFGLTLLAAVALFAIVTLVAIWMGDDRVELVAGEAVFYRFVTGPGGTLIHIGPAVFLLSALAGVAQILLTRQRPSTGTSPPEASA